MRILAAISLASLLAAPAVAPAQTVFGGVAGGAYLYPAEGVFVNAQASIGWRFSRRIETRIDGFAGIWGESYDGICANPAPYQACYPAKSGWGLAGNGVVNIIAPAHGPRAYLIGGVGAYHFNRYDEMAFGVSGGIGLTAPAGRRFRVVLETRYHHIVDGRFWLDDVMPVTLGIQF